MREAIIAAIICYNPETKRLRENIFALRKQVEKILIIDNASKNKNKILELLQELNDANITVINNNKNQGIAFGLNQALHYAKEHQYKWVLTMDQDSIIMEGLLDSYRSCYKIADLAMVSCVLMDRNVQECTFISQERYTEVDRCITSACLNNVEFCLKTGGYDEKMFIDYVDYEMCLRLKLNHYKIIRVNYYGLLHEVGNQTRRIKFAGKNVCIKGNPIEIHNESPIRDYYLFRNLVYILRKHGKNARGCTSFLHIIWRIGLIIVFEHDRKNKLKHICKGLKEGFIMEVEKTK